MGELGFPFRRLATREGLSYAIEITVTIVNLKHAYPTHRRVQGLRLPWFSGGKRKALLGVGRQSRDCAHEELHQELKG